MSKALESLPIHCQSAVRAAYHRSLDYQAGRLSLADLRAARDAAHWELGRPGVLAGEPPAAALILYCEQLSQEARA